VRLFGVPGAIGFPAHVPVPADAVRALPSVLPPLAGGSFLHVDLAPGPIAVLVAALALYLWGVVRNNRLHPRHPWPAGRTAGFVGGIAVAAVALVSFLGVYDTTLFWDHMVQHLMLIMVAAGLFAASSPVDLAWRASAGGAHRRFTRWLRSRPARLLGHPATAFVLYGVLVPLTHLTVFFNYAIELRAVDDLEHFLFVAIGYLFWRNIFGHDPNRYRLHPAVRALLLFFAVPVDTFVGLSLDNESHEIFPAFAAEHRTWGPSLVADLHLGGVIMWVGGDVLMTLGLIPVIVQWVRRDERRATRVDRVLDAYFPAPGTLGPSGGAAGGGERAGQPTAGYALGAHTPRRSTAHRRGRARAEPVDPA
jgi:putative copper resistance protein D